MNTQHRWARQWAFPLIFLLLATFFRFYRLDQLPPGLFHDEAFNGLDAQRLLRDGTFALFFPDNQGREPLHIYLQAGAMALLGQHPWSMRLVSAFVGVLAVGLIYRLGQALFPDKTRLFSVGTVAAFSLALSYWHVHHSRIALRAVFLVPLTAAALWFFWRGYQRQRWREFVWGGMALGISLYTYLPARLVPLIIVGFVGWHLSLSLHPKTAPSLRPKTIWLLKGSALMLLVALLVFAPLGIYFLTHPDYFLQRTGSVSILAPQNHLGQSTLSALATNTATVLGMFFFKGDVNPLLNLPGRPALDGVFAAAFLIGLLFALLQLKQPAYALLLIWFGVMLLPTLLSNQAPHFLRSIGILPPLTVFTGLGLHCLGGYLTYFLPQYRRYLWPALVGITFLSSGWFTYRDYFQHWATLPEVTDSFHTAEYMVGTNLVALSHTYDVLLPADVYEYPGTAFVINAAFEQITLVDSLPESRPLVFLHPSDQCRLQPIMVRFRGISETTGQVSRVDTARADVTTWVTGPLTRFAFMDNLARPLVIAAHLLPSQIGRAHV